jgi:hypothetical protein
MILNRQEKDMRKNHTPTYEEPEQMSGFKGRTPLPRKRYALTHTRLLRFPPGRKNSCFTRKTLIHRKGK